MSENIMRWRWARREVNWEMGLKRQLPTWQFFYYVLNTVLKKKGDLFFQFQASTF